MLTAAPFIPHDAFDITEKVALPGKDLMEHRLKPLLDLFGQRIDFGSPMVVRVKDGVERRGNDGADVIQLKAYLRNIPFEASNAVTGSRIFLFLIHSLPIRVGISKVTSSIVALSMEIYSGAGQVFGVRAG